WALSDRFPSYNGVRWLDRIGRLWHRLGKDDKAAAARDALRRIVQKGPLEKDLTEGDARAWAYLGHLNGIPGEEAESRDSIGKAVRILEESSKETSQKGYYRKDIVVGSYVDAAAMIGARQFAAGLKADAIVTYAKAYSRTDELESANTRDFYLR